MAKQGKGSKIKGDGYELAIAKKFGKWSGFEWRRVPRSGGFDKQTWRADIYPVGRVDNCPLGIECKDREGWEFQQLLKSPKKCQIISWWNDAVEEAEGLKRIPMLIFSKNYEKDFLIISWAFYGYLREWIGDISVGRHFVLDGRLRIFLLDEFIKQVDFETMWKCAEEIRK